MNDYVLYLDNDKLIQKDIETPNDKGEYAPATGLVITLSLALTKGGAFLPAFTNIAMTERTQHPGRYYAILDGAPMRTHLAAQVDGTVHLCYSLPGDLRVWEEYTVREFRG
jgi:hypothetical protein